MAFGKTLSKCLVFGISLPGALEFTGMCVKPGNNNRTAP
jgi:hypothetical protein